MGNFDFLQKEWADFAKLANSAEIYLYSDPNSCLIKLGILAEQIVNHIITANFIATIDNPTTHSDKISLIKKKGLAPVDIIDILYKLKKARNEAVHANLESVDEAISMLKYAHKLSFWFNLHYGKYHYIKFEPYILPEDSLRQELFEEIEAQRRAQCIREELEKFKLEEQKRKFEMEQRRKEYAHQREERKKKEAEERKRCAEEESLKLAEQKRMLEMLKRREEYLRQKEENERREAEEKRRKEEYERRQREEAKRKFQYSVKKTAILNDIKAFHSSLKKDDYFVNDYSQINEDIMTFTRNVNNNIYSNIEGLTNAYNNLINKIKSIKTISQVKAQKRRRNTIVSCLSCIAAVVVFVVLLFELILPTINYNKAVDLLEQNKYEEAGEIFEDLDGFKDSNEQVVVIDAELKYQNAVNLLNNNQLTEAKQIFVELNGYRDSNEKINAIDLELDYLQALDYYNNKNFSSAKLYFEKTPGYKQTAEYYSSVLNELEYIEATSLFEKRKYSEAQQKFETLNGFRDSNFYAQYINALELESAKKYLEAKEIFIELGSFKDSVLKASSLSITIANSYSAIRTYLQNNKYNKAVSLAEEIGVSVSYSYNLNGTADSNNLEGYAKIPSKNGYTFTSWDTLSYALNTDEATLTLDLSAEYNIITYNISYVDVRGNYDSTPTTQYTIQESVALPKIQHAGYTFLGWYENGTRIDNIAQGTIGDITLTAKYEAKQFTISYDFKNGNAQESQLVTYGEEYAVPNPTRVGYSFAGWFNDDIEYEGGIWNATTDKVLVASWTPNKNIAYKVNRHLQNVNDDNYTIDVTEELIGTADSSVTPEVKDYVGFTSPTAQTVNVAPDGSLVVDYYYTRNYYEISMVSNGGDKIDTIRKKYQSELNMPIAIRNGYTFGGWYTEQTQLNAFDGNTMPSESITLYAHWLEESKACDFTYAGTESYTITGYVGESNTMAIPSYIGGVAVVNIQSLAFENASITKAIVPESITEIGNAAFKGCYVLEDITLPFVGAKAGITSSDTYQYPLGYIFGTASYEGGTATSQYYYGYRLGSTTTTTYYIPTALKSITINGNNILYGAFSKCNNLTNITIGSSIKNIYQAFNGCSSLSSVNISDLSSWCGISFSDGSANPLYYAKKLYLNGELVTNLDVPNKVTEIKNYTFSGCTSITNVIIDGDTTSIGTYAFNGCSELRELKLGDAVLNIQHGAFYNCTKLDSLTLGNKLESIGNYAFRDCTSLTSMEIPNSVASIGNGAFGGCSSLENITLPFVGGSATATSASSGTLFGYIFGTNSYSGGIQTRQYYSNYSSTNYYIPDSLKHVTITGGKILYGALSGCSKLTSVIVADNVTNIGERAFGGCSSLESITLPFVGSSPTTTSASNSTLFGYIFGTNSYSGGTQTTQYYKSGYSQYYYIPDSLKLVTITGGNILYGSFYNCTKLNNITLPKSLTTIGDYAFYNCDSVMEFSLPNMVTHIGNYAFSGSNGLKNINIPNLVTIINTGTFSNCNNLSGIIIPNSVTNIGDSAFSGCANLSNVILSEKVSAIGSSAFSGCTKISKIIIPDSVTTMSNYAFYNCTNLLDIKLSNSLININSYAFYGCAGLANVIVPTSVAKIESYAFANCSNLTEINIADSVKNIMSNAFSNCNKLNRVNINDLSAWCNIEFTNESANPLYYAKNLYLNNELMTELIIPNGVVEIKDYAFYSAATLTNVVIPDSVVKMGSSVFGGCSSLESITLPFVGSNPTATSASNSTLFGYIFGTNSYSGGTQTTQYYANNSSISYCVPSSLRNVILTGGELLYGAFYNCTNLSNIIFDNSITSIGACAFQKCSGLVAIELPDMLMRLGASAFYNCTNLIEITLGGSIKNIANSSFANCNSLNSVHIKDLDSWCKIVFDNAYANPLYYAKNLYINDELVTDLEISNTIIEIKDYAFCCSSITSVDIGASSKNIGQYAFYNCLQLQKANIGNAIKNIGNYAFNNCINLTDISISNSVETIGNSAFYNCTKLDSLTLGNKLESIGNYAFRDCTSLTSMEIPNSVASIGNGAFGGCSSLENITIPFVGGSATATSASSSTLFGYIFGTSSYSGGTETRQYYSSGSSTYYYIPTSLKTVTITSGKILYGALSGCSKLTSVIVADNVTNIGERAFGGCSSLESITLPFVGGSATATSASSSTLLGYIFGTSSYSGGTKITQYYKSGYSQYYYIPDSLKLVTITGGKILYGAFYNCKYIEKVYISNSIKEIDTNAFYGCNGMKEIYYSGTLEQWNEIIVGNGNDILSTATIYYEYEAKKE